MNNWPAFCTCGSQDGVEYLYFSFRFLNHVAPAFQKLGTMLPLYLTSASVAGPLSLAESTLAAGKTHEHQLHLASEIEGGDNRGFFWGEGGRTR